MNTYQRLLAAALVLAAASSFAQPAIGYNDPDDVSTLLEYRLPDWGWRRWGGAVDIDGSGQTRDGSTSSENRIYLATDAGWFGEGEQRLWDLNVTSSIDLRSGNDDQEHRHRDSDRYRFEQGLDGSYRRYLGASPFYVGAGAAAGWSYQHSDLKDSQSDSIRYFGRYQEYSGELQCGVGHLRNVGPLIMAQRVSRRLVVLGRPALSPHQVQQVAEALSRRQGYLNTHDRPFRHFWEAVLEPVLDPERPLSPYEVEYLEDVDLEGLGTRRQGAYVGLRGSWTESRMIDDWGRSDRFTTFRDVPHRWAAGVNAAWSHNPSLTTQIGATTYASYVWESGDFDRERAQIRATVSYLRDVADRHQLWVDLVGTGHYDESPDGMIDRTFIGDIRIRDRYWIEDSLALVPEVSLRRVAESSNHGADGGPSTYWSYGIRLEYLFDSAVF